MYSETAGFSNCDIFGEIVQKPVINVTGFFHPANSENRDRKNGGIR
jgi:hypothetical protein